MIAMECEKCPIISFSLDRYDEFSVNLFLLCERGYVNYVIMFSLTLNTYIAPN